MQLPLENRSLGRGGPTVSFLGLGALEIGRDWGLGNADDRRRCDEQTAIAVVDCALDAGITIIDTARAYHLSEDRVGMALASRGNQVLLATKCGEHSADPDTYYDFTTDAINASIEESLLRLRTNRLDLLQVHWGPPQHEDLIWSDTVPAILAARDAGKTALIGASCPTERIKVCIESGYFDVLQVSYSLLDRTAEPGIQAAAEAGIGILVRDGLGGGRLTPRVLGAIGSEPSLAQQVVPLLDLLDADAIGVEAAAARLPELALSFLSRNPAISSVLVGTKSPAHLLDSIRAVAASPDSSLVDDAVRIVNRHH